MNKTSERPPCDSYDITIYGPVPATVMYGPLHPNQQPTVPSTEIPQSAWYTGASGILARLQTIEARLDKLENKKRRPGQQPQTLEAYAALLETGCLLTPAQAQTLANLLRSAVREIESANKKSPP